MAKISDVLKIDFPKYDHLSEYDFEYDLAEVLIKNVVYQKPFDSLRQQFERVDMFLDNIESYATINWIYKHNPTNTYWKIVASYDSWESVIPCFGDDFEFKQVYPKTVTKTIYVDEGVES